jgi:hypothetical protein
MVGAWWAAARALPPHVPLVASEAAGDICARAADKPRLLAELRRMLRPGGQVGFSDLVLTGRRPRPRTGRYRALLHHSARELLTDWPGLFAAAGFQLGTVRDIQAQTLPTWQHVQAVYRQHAAQIRVRYGRRLGPGIARRIDRQVAADRQGDGGDRGRGGPVVPQLRPVSSPPLLIVRAILR